MNTRKLIVKISYGLIIVLVLAVISLLVYHQRLIQQMSNNDQQVPSITSVSNSNTRAENKNQTTLIAEGGMEQLKSEVDTLRYQLEVAEEKLEMAREDLVNERGQVGNTQELIAIEKKMRENPSVMNRGAGTRKIGPGNSTGHFSRNLACRIKKLRIPI